MTRSSRPIDVLQVRWRRHLVEEPLIEYKPQEFASAASDGTRVFIGSSAKVLWALSTRDGSILWNRPLGGAIGGRPLYCRRDRPRLRRRRRRRRSTPSTRRPASSAGSIERTGRSRRSRSYADETLYFTSGENRVYALDARSGKWKWQYDREAPESFTIRGYPSPLVVGNKVYVGFSDGYLACLSAAGGDVVWARSLAGDATRFIDVDSTPLHYRDTLYVSAYATGVYALDPKDGSTRWRFDVEGATSVRARGSQALLHGGQVGPARARSRRAPLVAAGAGRGRRAVGADGGRLVRAGVVVERRHLRGRRAQRAALSVLRARARRDLGSRPATGARSTCCRTPATSTRWRSTSRPAQTEVGVDRGALPVCSSGLRFRSGRRAFSGSSGEAEIFFR